MPNVVVFHLKRFCYTGRQRRKLDTIIDFPLRRLDLGTYIQDKTTSHVYELSAICDHYGNLNDGHYKARAKVGVHSVFFFFLSTYLVAFFFFLIVYFCREKVIRVLKLLAASGWYMGSFR